ncbi:uncharacterized protein LOC131659326 [Vicia villosa]|uniref:uncharacterized protein LOC131659326 n=1 Tax=Vicia villosa TaxID=3911 RepID=UPI00273B94B2|nr:uncharacterized protein LOC131659326 [Vicia villosa]
MPYDVPNPYALQAYAAALPQPWVAPQLPFIPQQQVVAPQNRQQNPRPQGQRAPQRQRYPERRIDPVPMPYAQLLPQLLAGQLVQLREMGPPPSPLPLGYDANARCEFHSGAPGYTIEKCRALKYKVQDLLDDKIISFAPTGPNVQNNPMPPYAEECGRLRDEIQKLMDEGVIRVERVIPDEEVVVLEIPYYPADMTKARSAPLIIQTPSTPLVIQTPNTPLFIRPQAPQTPSLTPSLLVDSKAVPWMGNSNVTNIVGTSGITRSGRIFAAPPPPPKETNKDVNTQTKGKQVVVDPPEPRTAQDAEQLLRIIKKSDYKFEGVVTNIAAGNCLGFCDDELPTEGRAHNKALHISMRCLDTVLSRFLIDTGSSLNVMPKATLFKLSMDGVMMRPCTMSVRAFDGSRRSVEGEIDLPVKIGPHTFYISFYVMDIRPSYTCLLGRPWIHAAGAVTSTLHQCLKFVVGDKIVVITGEEDLVVNNLATY